MSKKTTNNSNASGNKGKTSSTSGGNKGGSNGKRTRTRKSGNASRQDRADSNYDKTNSDGSDSGKGDSSAGGANTKFGLHAPLPPRSNVALGQSPNDPKWGDNQPQIAKNAGELQYNYPVGTMLKFDEKTDATIGGKALVCDYAKSKRSIEGIMRLEVLPTIGLCQSPTDPPNIAFQQMYAKLREKNSNSMQYDKTDLGMVNIAMMSAYSLYEFLARGYKALNAYKFTNKYMPLGLLRAMKISNQLSSQITQFKSVMDMFAYKLNSVNIPNVLDVHKRMAWLFTNIYGDNGEDKCQIYMFQPYGFYIWSEGDEADPQPSLKMTKFNDIFGISGKPSQIETIEQITTAINKVMDPILGSSAVDMISSDLNKYYPDNLIKMGVLDEMETIAIAYSEEVLMEIENAMWLTATMVDCDITSNQTDLKAGPQLQCNMSGICSNYTGLLSLIHKPLLNTHVDSMNYLENLVATRFMFTLSNNSVVSENNPTFQIESMGTELITRVDVFYTGPSVEGGMNVSSYTSRQIDQNLVVNLPTEALDVLQREFSSLKTDIERISAFNHHPTLYTMTGVNTMESGSVVPSGVYTLDGFIQNTDTYTFVGRSEIRQMHEAYVISLFTLLG